MSMQDEPALVYDGECPFCSRYVAYVRLQDSIGKVKMINARDGGPIVDDIRKHGLDLDEGMVLRLGVKYYHGADCINMLALLSSRSGWFNSMNAFIFRSPALSRILYPFLRSGRNCALRLLGRGKLSSVSQPKGNAPDP